MAPTWFGPHLVAKCTECGQQSEIILEAYDPAITTRCFSCGAICDCPKESHEGKSRVGEIHPSEIHPGEVVEISRLASTTGLKRFDIVTFRSSKQDDESPETLKRIWALPGESVELRGGNAWIDGKPLQKNIREFSSICVPLSRFPKDARSHWWLTDDTTGVRAQIDVAAKQGQASLESGQRLEFRYARPNRSPEPPAMLPSPIVNDYAFNQNSIAQHHEVTDVLLAIELAKPTVAPWSVTIQSEGKLYKVLVGVNADANGNGVGVEKSERLVCAICDGRLLVSTESKDYQWELADLESELGMEEALNGSSIRIAPSIGTTETLTISRLLVARDQWLGPRESRERDWAPIGHAIQMEPSVAEGYFVLGDNLELSIDSRDAAVGRIRPNQITGQAKRLSDANDWIQELLDHTFRDVSKDDLIRESHYSGLMNSAR